MSKDLESRGKFVRIWNMCHRTFSKRRTTESWWRI